MLQVTTDNILDSLLYPDLKEAWNNIKSVDKKRKILNKVGISSVHLWRLLSKKINDEPMREAYLIVLKRELLEPNAEGALS